MREWFWDFLCPKSGVWLTESLFVNLSVEKIFHFANIPARFLESLPYLRDVATTELYRYPSKLDVTFTRYLDIIVNLENDGTEGIASVSPAPDLYQYIVIFMLYTVSNRVEPSYK